MKKFSGILLFLFLELSCSIKADRSICPCQVSLSVSGTPDEIVTLLSESSSAIQSYNVALPSGEGNVQLSRGNLRLAIYSGLDNCRIENGKVVVKRGLEMDQIYAWSDDVRLDADTASIHAELTKQFALLHLQMVGFKTENFPSEISVHSDVCGFDLRSMSPVAGKYEISLNPVIGRYYRICMPRQKDDSLELEISGTGTRLPLGEYIREVGYDWSSTSLSDIYVDVDYSRTKVQIKINDWEEGAIFSFVI